MSTATGGRRADRVAERIKVELMDLLLRGELRDPGARDAYVTGVAVSDDLSLARVFVRALGDEKQQAEQQRVVAALNRASGYLRRELASRIELKHQPELKFMWDAGVERAARIEQLLSEIQREGRS
jgi:ribosome-binding factor A